MNSAPLQSSRRQVAPFNKFKEEFSREISLSDFGAKKVDSIAVGAFSPSATELRRTGAKDLLLANDFLKAAHRSLKEYARLVNEIPKARHASATIGSFIKILRNRQKKLISLQEEIKGLYKQLDGTLANHHRERLYNAVHELESVEDALVRIERGQVANMHPELRRKHNESLRRKTGGSHPDQAKVERLKYTPGFGSLLPLFEYGLDSLKNKAPYQWLLEKLDSQLKRLFRKHQKGITDSTRYRIVAEVLVSGGVDEVSPEGIKEYFQQKPKTVKPPSETVARNSQAT